MEGLKKPRVDLLTTAQNVGGPNFCTDDNIT